MKELLTYEEWCDINEQELTCIFAETGRDREMCYDREADEEFIYDHIETYSHDYPQLVWYKSLVHKD